MQRFITRAVVVAAAVLSFAGSTYASSFTSTFDPDDVLFNKDGGTCTSTNSPDTVTGQASGACLTLSYTHVLQGYSNPPDTLTSASLTLYFDDDVDRANPDSDGNPESVTIDLDKSTLQQLSLGEVLLTSAADRTPNFSDVRAQVFANGTLNVLLGVGPTGFGQNDFRFLKSELNASWDVQSDDETPRNVPEPASLLLVGSGIGGTLMRMRRRFA